MVPWHDVGLCSEELEPFASLDSRLASHFYIWIITLRSLDVETDRKTMSDKFCEGGKSKTQTIAQGYASNPGASLKLDE